MIRRKLKDFFMNRLRNGHILEMLNSEELSLIDRFLTTGDGDRKEYLAAELMELTLRNIDPGFPIFERLFEIESQKLSSMEKGVIYMKDDYRSHYIHSVYTYLMGFFLFQEKLLGDGFFKCLHLSYFDTHYKDRPFYDSIGVQSKNEKKEFQKRWAIAVFFHDLAYPSQVNLEIMQAEGERLINLERPYSVTINDLQSFLINPRMAKIKEKVKMSFAPEYLYEEDMLEILAHRMVNRLQSFSKDIIYQSLRELIMNGLKQGFFDHGLFGSLFLLQQFYSQLYSFFVEEKDNTGIHSNRLSIGDKITRFTRNKLSINRNITRFTDAMVAVALHNIKNFKTGIFKPALNLKIVSNRLPLAFLLILSDELQAWTREMEPPRPSIQLKSIRGSLKKRLDKYMFIDHFYYLYQEYASPQVSDNRMVFFIPFWKVGTDENRSESITYEIKIKKKDEESFLIEFKMKRMYFLSKLLSEHDNESIEYKKATELEKESWERFKKDNKTLGQFIDLVFAFKEFLDINSQKENTVKVKSLECLIKDILPALKLLTKGQDILFSYFKPHHFHDINLPEEAGDSCGDCKLLLRYPGKEVQDIETIIKDNLGQELDHTKQKRPIINYADSSETNLNRIINEKYIPKIENYIYGIQQGKYKVVGS